MARITVSSTKAPTVQGATTFKGYVCIVADEVVLHLPGTGPSNLAIARELGAALIAKADEIEAALAATAALAPPA